MKEIILKKLYAEHSLQLLLLAKSLVGKDDVAEDIVQDFFIKYWQHSDHIQFRYSFKAYASKSVYNACISYLRKPIVNTPVVPISEIEEFIAEDIAAILENEHKELLLSHLHQAIEELPARCKKIFLQVYFNGKKHIEVAEELDISVNTVKVQMSKAYRFLREKMQERALFLIMLLRSTHQT